MRSMSVPLLAVLLILGLGAPGSSAAAPSDHVYSKEVLGEGPTSQAARRDALEKARVELDRFLDRHYPDIAFRPTSDYLERQRMVTLRPPGEDGTVAGRLDLREFHLEGMRELTRFQHIEQRHRQAAAVLALAVLALLLGAALLRLDEAMSLSPARRVLAAAGVAAVVAASWWYWVGF